MLWLFRHGHTFYIRSYYCTAILLYFSSVLMGLPLVDSGEENAEEDKKAKADKK